jgi:hypothetical protein
MLALRHRLGTEGRDGCHVRHCHAAYDDGSVSLGRKDRDGERSRGRQAGAPSPGVAPRGDARQSPSHVGLPLLLIASLRDNVDDSLDLAFAADCRKAAPARGKVFSIGVALLVAGLSESDGAGQYLGRSAV